MSEILNIEYHSIRLSIKALNKFQSVSKAAKALGMSERNLSRWIKEYALIKADEEWKCHYQFPIRILPVNNPG